MKTQRILIVGDIHGCPDELDKLLRHAGYDESGDKLVLVGDLIAKGPDSKGVIDRARQWKAQCVRGNHEAHCLRYESARREGKSLPKLSLTHQQVINSISQDDFDWIFEFPFHLHFPEHNVRIVHAGFDPSKKITEQDPDVMINMRSIRYDGVPSKKIEDGVPWASIWKGPETVIFGHDAVRKLQLYPHAVGLDTGCVYGGELTAVELPSMRRFSVRAKREYCPIE